MSGPDDARLVEYVARVLLDAARQEIPGADADWTFWADDARALIATVREADSVKLSQAITLLEEHVNEGDVINHAWAFICRYCGKCSDDRLEHEADCPFVRLRGATDG